MEMSISQITHVFRIYQTQARIAELNRQNNVRTVQQQADRVTVSDEARRLLQTKEEHVAPPGTPGAPQSATADAAAIAQA